MDPTNIALSIKDLTVAFDKKPILWDIDLDIPKGTLTAIVGPKWCRKKHVIKSGSGNYLPDCRSVWIFLGSHLTDNDHKSLTFHNETKSIGTSPQRFLMWSYGNLR